MGNFKKKLHMFFIGLFYGLRGADATMLTQSDSSDGVSIDHQLHVGGVMDDFLQEKETQQVKEVRDAYYRLLFEADKFSVVLTLDKDGELTGARSYRNNGKWIKPPKDVVDLSDGMKVRVIQNNEIIPKESNLLLNPYFRDTASIYEELLKKNPLDYLVLLELDYGEQTPRFQLAKYVKKMVIKNYPDGNRAKLELYVSKYQEQFNQMHIIFLNELRKVREVENYKTDLFSFNRAGFVTNGRAWGSSPAAVFSYQNFTYLGMTEFDGNYVISFDCDIINDGTNVGEKYRTKELDEKYATKAPKSDSVDIFAAERRAKEDSLDLTIQ